MGSAALFNNTTASNNTAVGYQAGYSNTTGGPITAVGYQALFANTTGTNNTAVGDRALLSNTTGGSNIAVGLYALGNNTIGGSNVAMGQQALNGNTTGLGNTALGYQSLYTQAGAANYNTAMGYQAGFGITTGGVNTTLGYLSGNGITTGNYNVIIGGYTGSAAPISGTGSNFIVLSDGAGNVRGTFDGSGNLGLGVTPSAWNSSYKVLQVGAGTILSQPGAPAVIDVYANAYIDSAFANKYISTAPASHYEQNGGVHRWFNAPSGTAGAAITFTQAMTLNASGNLGIGTTSPVAKLDVVGNIRTNGSFLAQINNGVNFNSGSDTNNVITANSGTGCMQYSGFSGHIFYTTNGGSLERARIDSNGNLLVGTNSAGSEIGRLTVKQSADADYGGLRLIAPNSTNVWAIRTGSDDNLYFGYIGTAKASINNTTGNYNTLSDARLKENVKKSAKGLSEILALRSVSYTFIDDEAKTEQLGFIAQEVDLVIPEVITAPTASNQYYGLNYAGVVPVLVKAIQEQQALIESLTQRLTALESK